jgi:hypothetical protein
MGLNSVVLGGFLLARLNVEDSFWSDDSYQLLVENVGANLAAGMCLRFMRLAQRHWVKSELVPLEVFQRNGWEPLLDCGFALYRDEGVYCRGSEQNFDWLVKCAENGRKGGKKSAESRKADKTDTYNKANPTDTKANASERKPLTLTLTPTLSSSSLVPEKKAPTMTVNKLREIWNEHKTDNMPACQKISDGTERHILAKARVTEIPDPAYWVSVVKRVAQSPHCNGENDRGWKAHFLWLVRADSHARAMEGLYDPKKRPPPKLRPDLKEAPPVAPPPVLSQEEIARRRQVLDEVFKR